MLSMFQRYKSPFLVYKRKDGRHVDQKGKFVNLLEQGRKHREWLEGQSLLTRTANEVARVLGGGR